MRQSGILAAGGLYALKHHIPLLQRDHENAQRLAAGLAETPGVRLDPWPETNLVFVGVSGTNVSADMLRAQLGAEGVLCSGAGERLRFVTHLDISEKDIDTALAAIRRVLGPGSPARSAS
jgi:threonine aldolase